MKKATPNFVLSNQFLIWVDKKILVYYDFDLIPADYYKKWLEFQLKNRKTNIKTLVLTELNESTGLRLSTEWTLYTKLLSLRPSYFLPSPPLFLPFLSSNLTLSSATPLIFQFYFWPNSSSLFLHYPSVKSYISEMTSITNKTKMTKQDISTPNNILLAPIVQIPYIMARFYREIPSTLFFKGSNITNFFIWYELICNDFQIEEK